MAEKDEQNDRSHKPIYQSRPKSQTEFIRRRRTTVGPNLLYLAPHRSEAEIRSRRTVAGILKTRKITKNMQNKPNPTAQYARSLPAVLLAGHTQYEIINAKRSQFYDQRTHQTRKRCKFYPNFPFSLAIIYPPKAAFPQQLWKIARLLQLSDINTLNSMYNKDLHEILPA